MTQRLQQPKKACQSLKYLQIIPENMLEVDSAIPNIIPECILLPGSEVQQNNASQAMNHTWGAIMHSNSKDFLSLADSSLLSIECFT